MSLMNSVCIINLELETRLCKMMKPCSKLNFLNFKVTTFSRSRELVLSFDCLPVSDCMLPVVCLISL